MLREEIELIKAHARIIVKEEIAAMPKGDDPLKDIDSKIQERVDYLFRPLAAKIQELERKLRELPKFVDPAPVSKKKGR